MIVLKMIGGKRMCVAWIDDRGDIIFYDAHLLDGWRIYDK